MTAYEKIYDRAADNYGYITTKEAVELGVPKSEMSALANTIVAQMMPECVIKGGSSLKFRYGDIATRVTKDMDAAQGADLDAFIVRLDEAVAWANELIEKIDNA